MEEGGSREKAALQLYQRAEVKSVGIFIASMVTAYPLPEGFTELEVFAIGTALLVEGKLGAGPQQQ